MTPARAFTMALALASSGSSGPASVSSETLAKEPARSFAGVPRPPDRAAQIREQHLPNVELTTHEGKVVRFYDDLVKGRIVAINFMFATCREACLAATEHLVAAQRALRENMRQDVRFLSISLEPESDTPERLRGYALAHGAGRGFYFLTGRRADVELLRHKLGAYDLDPVVDADRTQHAGIVILGNEPRARWKAISALSNPVRIRQAIERTILPPERWPKGAAVVNEVPEEDHEVIEPVDLSRLPPLTGNEP